MSHQYRVRNHYQIHFVTFTVDWVDIFTKPVYKRIIVDSLSYCQKNKGLNLYAWYRLMSLFYSLILLEILKNSPIRK